MNERELYKAFSFIDDDLITEAAVKTDVSKQAKSPVSKRNIYTLGSVAAAAVITIGSAALYNAHKPSEFLLDHSIVDTDTSKNDQPDGNDTNTVSTQSATERSDSFTKADDQSKNTTDNHSRPANPSDPHIEKDTETTVVQDAPVIDNSSVINDDPDISQPTDQGIETTDSPHSDDNHTKSNCYLQKFPATVDPSSDAYGQDELPFVKIIVSGNTYTQLDESEYGTYNVDNSVTDSDFGEYIGNIVELSEYEDPSKYSVSSQEPNLAGADVYYYAPANSRSVIIVKKREQCSIFTMNGMAANSDTGESIFAQTFRFYGAESSDDVQNISFTVSTLNDGTFEITSEGIITDRDMIRAVTDILFQLTPEQTSSDPLSVTPQWLNDAWNVYRTNPDACIREDIMFSITFQNGTVLQDITYQPYLGNGYVSDMKELTSEQNQKLRELFR
jgi:hypothetical protein rflaF_04352